MHVLINQHDNNGLLLEQARETANISTRPDFTLLFFHFFFGTTAPSSPSFKVYHGTMARCLGRIGLLLLLFHGPRVFFNGSWRSALPEDGRSATEVVRLQLTALRENNPALRRGTEGGGSFLEV